MTTLFILYIPIVHLYDNFDISTSKFNEVIDF